jgi:RES domain
VGRAPDPWRPPDWSYASPDGTFGNRFDDPKSFYRVLYSASQQTACYIETLARFRVDMKLLAELKEIEGEDDFFPLGHVPSEWASSRLLGSASAVGQFAAICASGWLNQLRADLAGACLSLGISELDASVLQSRSNFAITHLASREVYKRGFQGIYYLSRHGHNFENWALFEPFDLRDAAVKRISTDDPALLEALEILGLKLLH